MKKELFNIYEEIVSTILKTNYEVKDENEFYAIYDKKENSLERFSTIGVGVSKDYSIESVNDILSRIKNKEICFELFCTLHELGHIKTYSKKLDKQTKKYYTQFAKTKNTIKANKIHNKIIMEKMADG